MSSNQNQSRQGRVKVLCNCCNRYEMDAWTNGGPACQWCLAARCDDADECQVLDQAAPQRARRFSP